MDNFRESRIRAHRCPSCEAMMINGHYCHETGCPDSHLFVKRECPWCGQTFSPETREQKFCSNDCAEAYFG